MVKTDIGHGTASGSYLVHYTGVDAAHAQNATILISGPDLQSLVNLELVHKRRPRGRGLAPLLAPPPARNRADTDIAFAASTALEGELIALYYSIEDRILRRAMVRRYD